MSFMPNEGTKVRLRDGRIGTVSKVTPRGDDDRVVFDDQSDARITAWDIDEIISEPNDQPKSPRARTFRSEPASQKGLRIHPQWCTNGMEYCRRLGT